VRVFRSFLRIVAAVLGVVLLVWIVVAQPTFDGNQPSSRAVDPARLRVHVTRLATELAPRRHKASENLNACAAYIRASLDEAGARAEVQEFQADGATFRNVIGRFGPQHGADQPRLRRHRPRASSANEESATDVLQSVASIFARGDVMQEP
jgi:hypothetical protein